ncbi:MAG: alpha/beta hydrolase [Bacteroidetes bacterium]|nr:alpha/beta hydrolase [Bacteroidota bacterium]
MEIKEINLETAHNRELILKLRVPSTNIKGVVQINTGTCIPQKIYWKFAEYLSQHGYVTITYDYTDAQNYTSNIRHETWLEDIESVCQYVLQQYPNEKKYIVGHSSGGQFIGYAKSAAQFDKLFLVACANGYVGNLKFGMRIVMRFFWKIIVPLNVRYFGYMNNEIFGVRGGFPKNIIQELGYWCTQPDFFVSYFKNKNIPSYYHTITTKVKAYHLADDAVANKKSCEFILNLYSQANKSIETLNAADYGIKKFGHRGFFFPSAEKKLWSKFLKELDN